MDPIYVHTLGDSTLDNIYWMIDQSSNMRIAHENSVEGQLRKNLGDPYQVVSHAYDGFTTSSVLEGDTVGDVLPRGPTKMHYTLAKESLKNVKPLSRLQESIAQHPNSIHYVVISVGGNDFRVNLRNPVRMLLDIPKVEERYLQIVEQVKSMADRNVRPILMFQYRTDANNDPYLIYTIMKVLGTITAITDVVFGAMAVLTPIAMLIGKICPVAGTILTLIGGLGLYVSSQFVPLSIVKDVLTEKKSGVAMFDALLKLFYKPIVAQAQQDNLPILDLTTTFDPCQDLYTSGIEPNKKGGALIAEGISHIVKQHDFTSISKSYSKTSGSTAYQAHDV